MALQILIGQDRVRLPVFALWRIENIFWKRQPVHLGLTKTALQHFGFVCLTTKVNSFPVQLRFPPILTRDVLISTCTYREATHFSSDCNFLHWESTLVQYVPTPIPNENPFQRKLIFTCSKNWKCFDRNVEGYKDKNVRVRFSSHKCKKYNTLYGKVKF